MFIRSIAFAAVALAVHILPAAAASVSYEASNAVSDPARYSGTSDHSVIINGDNFTFDTGTIFQFDDATGAASLTGDALLGAAGFSVDMSLNAIEWGDIPSGGDTPSEPKVELDLSGTGIDPLTDWTAFEFLSGTMTVIGDLTLQSRQSDGGPMESFSFSDGDILTIFSRPPSGQYTFQIGEGANGKNTNFGLAGWFGFIDSEGTVYCDGMYNICDFNNDLEVVPLPMSALLLPAGLGLLWSLKRRRRPA